MKRKPTRGDVLAWFLHLKLAQHRDVPSPMLVAEWLLEFEKPLLQAHDAHLRKQLPDYGRAFIDLSHDTTGGE